MLLILRVLFAFMIFLSLGTSAFCRSNSKPTPPYKVKSENYTFKARETLSEVLLARGVGEKNSPFFLYGGAGWLNYNKALNPAIKNWDHLPPGATITLYYPYLTEEAQKPLPASVTKIAEKKGDIIIVEPMQFDVSKRTKKPF